MTIILTVLLILTFSHDTLAQNFPAATGCEIVVDDFAEGIGPGWKPESFHGETQYTWTSEGNKNFIRATSNGTASNLYYKIKYNPRQYPFITWQWLVDKIVAGGDATRKSSDDYSARIYVVFPSFAFLNTRAINYIWANRLPKDRMIASPYAANSIMISVESGLPEAGKWLTEIRNVYEDYRRAFGEDPPEVGGIAIMTDSDDTGESAAANYGPIAVCSQNPGNH
jgi:Protein of unknown function (DUF3047)